MHLQLTWRLDAKLSYHVVVHMNESAESRNRGVLGFELRDSGP